MAQLFKLCEPVVYVIAFCGIFTAAFLLHLEHYRHFYGQLYKLRYNSNLGQFRRSLRDLLNNEKDEQIFRDAGHPFGLTGLKFSFLRAAVLIGGLSVMVLKWMLGSSSFSLSTAVVLVIFYWATSTEKITPVRFLLGKLKDIHNLKKNRECFLLYSMLLNEFYLDDGQPYNLYAILSRLTNYFNAIKPALFKTLAVWKRSPDWALDQFALEVGTEEARDLAQILKSIDAANASQAKDIIRSRYEQFQNNRHEQHRRVLKNIDLLGYIIVFIPTIAILFNMVFVLGIAVQDLLQKLNYQ